MAFGCHNPTRAPSSVTLIPFGNHFPSVCLSCTWRCLELAAVHCLSSFSPYSWLRYFAFTTLIQAIIQEDPGYNANGSYRVGCVTKIILHFVFAPSDATSFSLHMRDFPLHQCHQFTFWLLLQMVFWHPQQHLNGSSVVAFSSAVLSLLLMKQRQGIPIFCEGFQV